VFFGNRFDAILHCATHYGRNEPDPLQTVEANLLLPLGLLELGFRNGVRLFVNTDTILDKRVNTYSLSKSQFKDWLQAYGEKMVCINVALEHFYGPGDDKSKFVSSIIDSFLKQQEFLDLTPGFQTRDFIYVDDVISAFVAILSAPIAQSNGFKDFEIGTGNPIAIRHFVELVREISAAKTELRFGAIEYRPNEVMSRVTNIQEISSLGWVPKFSLISGLKETIEHERRMVGK